MIGHVDRLSRSVIAGWAADPSHPEREVPVRITVNGLRTPVIANILRDDLKEKFQNATGRYGFQLDSEFLPLSPFIDHQIDIEFADTGKPVPGGGHGRISAMGSALPAMDGTGYRMPIVVTGTGRTGSSLLMRRLALHPLILVARDHPYELKLLTYYGQALRTLTAEADRKRSSNPDGIGLAPNRFFIGFNPFHERNDTKDPLFSSFWNMTAPDMLRTSFGALIQEYYSRVSERTNKPDAQFFAEKIGTVDLARQGAAFMFGKVSEIVLVRDPRDVVCSSRAFWKSNFAESVKGLRGSFISMSKPRFERGFTQHVVRYEDLLTRTTETITAVFAFLGLPAADLQADTEIEARTFERHGTTASPEETIGRWRRELSDEEAAIANREFAPFLDQFGYEAT